VPRSKLNNTSIGGYLRFDKVVATHKDSTIFEHPCHSAVFDELVNALGSFPPVNSSSFDRKRSIRDALSSQLTAELGWVNQLLGIEGVPPNLHNKNYVVDFAKDSNLSGCTNRHRVLVEICFDNRQAIGTNVFKLDSAARSFRERTGGEAVGVIICADRKALKSGGWDPGVADEEEYLVALDTAYSHYLLSPISLLVMRT